MSTQCVEFVEIKAKFCPSLKVEEDISAYRHRSDDLLNVIFVNIVFLSQAVNMLD